MLHNLPFETLTHIFSHFALSLPRKSDTFKDYRSVRNHEDPADEAARHFQNRRTLRALCLVCSRFRAVASPMLYHTVILHDAVALPFFTRALLESPQAGDAVRNLASLVTFNSKSESKRLCDCVFKGLWADIGQGLFGNKARQIQPYEFDWNVRVSDACQPADAAMHTQIIERKLCTKEVVHSLKRKLFDWVGQGMAHIRPHMNELIQGFLYCILRETPRVQRLLLQFPVHWGLTDIRFQQFEELQKCNASTAPDFCSSLSELILSTNPQTGFPEVLIGGQFSFQYFHTLKTLMAFKSIRHLHLIDTAVQPRTLCGMILKIPQKLVSLTIKQRPSDPSDQPNPEDLPTAETPTLSEALLLKGGELRQLTLVFCYTTCFKNFIGSNQCLTTLPALDRLEKLTIQMQLLFGKTQNFRDKVDLACLLPPNLVELVVLDEWEMDSIERQAWLYYWEDPRWQYHYDMDSFLGDKMVPYVQTDGFPFSHISPEEFEIYSDLVAPKGMGLYSLYHTMVRAMLLDLAADCYAARIDSRAETVDGQVNIRKFASLRSVTFQVASNKPLKLVPSPHKHDRSAGEWEHVVPSLDKIEYSMEDAIEAVQNSSFLCWIPHRWTGMEFGQLFYNTGDEMSVWFIRDTGSSAKNKNDAEDEEEGEEVPEFNGAYQNEPKLIALWNAFRNIPREQFTDVTEAFAKCGIQFDCFGDSKPWLLAIRDAAKVELQEKGLDEVVVEEDL